ncbi:hypothetical protein FOCC_FOCC006846 [Frankliniella occidentalis]|nr:hypothetical protein FOCC_FOCC006846 [Frankliniella occidentalis]
MDQSPSPPCAEQSPPPPPSASTPSASAPTPPPPPPPTGTMVHRTPIEWQGWFPARYVFVVMGGLAIFNAYAMRSAMSVAITEMAKAKSSVPSSEVPESERCVSADAAAAGANSTHTGNPPEFDWDEEVQGQVLSAMFWGYVAMNVPSGLMADRFGGKRVLFVGILTCSLSCLLIPLAARKGGPVAVVVARIFEGLGENGLISATPNLATWICAFASGWISDWLIRTEKISIPVHRRTFTTF